MSAVRTEVDERSRLAGTNKFEVLLFRLGQGPDGCNARFGINVFKYVMAKTGKEAWDKLQSMAQEAKAEGKSISDKVAAVLTDLEMPEMDGLTLTRKIKDDERFKAIAVFVHSSLAGQANQAHATIQGPKTRWVDSSPRH